MDIKMRRNYKYKEADKIGEGRRWNEKVKNVMQCIANVAHRCYTYFKQ